MLELGIIASTVVGKYLVPALKSGWDHFFESAGDTVGAAAADETKKVANGIWARVRAAFGKNADGAAVLDQFEKMPEAAAPLVQAMLEQMLSHDRALAKDLSELLERRVDGARSGDQIIADTVYQVNAQHAHVETGGTIAAVVYGQSNRRPLPTPTTDRRQ
jgi:hypothetical protein